MHLALSSSAYPMSNRGGDGGFTKLKCEMPLWTMLLYKSPTNPHTTRWGLAGENLTHHTSEQFMYTVSR